MIDKKALLGGLAVTIIFLAGVLLGDSVQSIYKAKAIKNNCAYYHSQTGEFTWKEGEE